MGPEAQQAKSLNIHVEASGSSGSSAWSRDGSPPTTSRRATRMGTNRRKRLERNNLFFFFMLPDYNKPVDSGFIIMAGAFLRKNSRPPRLLGVKSKGS